MKRIFKLFLSLLIMTVMFLGANGNVRAGEVHGSVKLTGSVPVGDGYNLFTVEPSDNTHAYCLDADKTAPKTNVNGPVFNKIDDAGLSKDQINRMMAVLRTSGDGNPNYTLGLSEKESFYVTQAALWYAEYGDPSNYVTNGRKGKGAFTPELLEKIQKNYPAAYNKLMGAINAAKNNDFIKGDASISINATNGDTMHLKTIDGKKYMVSDSTFTVKSPGKYTVTVNGGNLADANENNTGKNTASYGGNDSFKIIIPVETEGKVSAKFTVTTDDNYVTGYQLVAYKYSDNVQRLALLYKMEDKLSTSYTVNGEYKAPKQTDIKIAKVNTEGKLIAGAKLGIYKEDGTEVGTYDSTTDYITVSLKPGNYSLKEISAPEGYLFSDAEVKFSIDNDGNVKDSNGNVVADKTFKFENKAKPDVPNGGKVIISKKDFTTGKEIEGAHLAILHEDGTPVYQNGEKLEWISGSTEKQFDMLPEGKYILVESVPAAVYNVEMIIDGMVTSRYNFEVVNGQITRIDVYNEYITDVPVTGMNVSSIYVVGSMVVLAGIGTIVVARKKEQM